MIHLLMLTVAESSSRVQGGGLGVGGFNWTLFLMFMCSLNPLEIPADAQARTLNIRLLTPTQISSQRMGRLWSMACLARIVPSFVQAKHDLKYCSDEGLTLETSANTFFMAFSIPMSTFCWCSACPVVSIVINKSSGAFSGDIRDGFQLL